ncbi:DUF2155 domain-containing protein [Acidocella aromatica]|uniref:Uncharacterized protein n=1 Tax=Acidocella aromatica TaxID=1303579 RepID=A0A840VI93_9PROT|nr:DUF2155 domain-containing protein [Acidocella aromatica]MBB5372905.1 hypothetical protein [Acidocella aromatica]
MRISAAALLLLMGPGVAWAQNDQSMIVIPPAPPVVAAPSSAAPAPVAPAAPVASQTLPAVPPVQSQTLPAVPPVPSAATTPPPAAVPAQPGTPPAQAASTQPAPPDIAPIPANDWTPGHTATLGVLNEVDGSTSQVSVPVGGQPAKAGDVLVSVQACATRPPQDLPDTAVFLTVQPADGGGAAPLYRGWMLRSAPGAAVVGNAAESFRVISCS